MLWKSYIDFEIEQEEYDNTRGLYKRLLQRTQHVKVRAVPLTLVTVLLPTVPCYITHLPNTHSGSVTHQTILDHFVILPNVLPAGLDQLCPV